MPAIRPQSAGRARSQTRHAYSTLHTSSNTRPSSASASRSKQFDDSGIRRPAWDDSPVSRMESVSVCTGSGLSEKLRKIVADANVAVETAVGQGPLAASAAKVLKDETFFSPLSDSPLSTFMVWNPRLCLSFYAGEGVTGLLVTATATKGTEHAMPGSPNRFPQPYSGSPMTGGPSHGLGRFHGVAHSANEFCLRSPPPLPEAT